MLKAIAYNAVAFFLRNRHCITTIKIVLSCEKFFMCLFFENLQNFMLLYLLEGMLHMNVEIVR